MSTNECPTCQKPRCCNLNEPCPDIRIPEELGCHGHAAPPAVEPQTTGIGLSRKIWAFGEPMLVEAAPETPAGYGFYLAADVDRRWAEREADHARIVAEKDALLAHYKEAETALFKAWSTMQEDGQEIAALRAEIERLKMDVSAADTRLGERVIEIARLKAERDALKGEFVATASAVMQNELFQRRIEENERLAEVARDMQQLADEAGP